MAHNIPDDWISAWLDDELSDSERRQFEAALAEDDELRDRVESLRRVGDDLRRLPTHRLPASFAADLINRIDSAAVLPAPLDAQLSNGSSGAKTIDPAAASGSEPNDLASPKTEAIISPLANTDFPESDFSTGAHGMPDGQVAREWSGFRGRGRLRTWAIVAVGSLAAMLLVSVSLMQVYEPLYQTAMEAGQVSSESSSAPSSPALTRGGASLPEAAEPSSESSRGAPDSMISNQPFPYESMSADNDASEERDAGEAESIADLNQGTDPGHLNGAGRRLGVGGGLGGMPSGGGRFTDDGEPLSRAGAGRNGVARSYSGPVDPQIPRDRSRNSRMMARSTPDIRGGAGGGMPSPAGPDANSGRNLGAPGVSPSGVAVPSGPSDGPGQANAADRANAGSQGADSAMNQARLPPGGSPLRGVDSEDLSAIAGSGGSVPNATPANNAPPRSAMRGSLEDAPADHFAEPKDQNLGLNDVDDRGVDGQSLQRTFADSPAQRDQEALLGATWVAVLPSNRLALKVDFAQADSARENEHHLELDPSVDISNWALFELSQANSLAKMRSNLADSNPIAGAEPNRNEPEQSAENASEPEQVGQPELMQAVPGYQSFASDNELPFDVLEVVDTPERIGELLAWIEQQPNTEAFRVAVTRFERESRQLAQTWQIDAENETDPERLAELERVSGLGETAEKQDAFGRRQESRFLAMGLNRSNEIPEVFGRPERPLYQARFMEADEAQWLGYLDILPALEADQLAELEQNRFDIADGIEASEPSALMSGGLGSAPYEAPPAPPQEERDSLDDQASHTYWFDHQGTVPFFAIPRLEAKVLHSSSLDGAEATRNGTDADQGVAEQPESTTGDDAQSAEGSTAVAADGGATAESEASLGQDLAADEKALEPQRWSRLLILVPRSSPNREPSGKD